MSEEKHYKKCPFCGNEPVYDQMMVWDTGYDELLRHPLHPLEGIGLPCPLSGLLFRKTKWEFRPIPAGLTVSDGEIMLMGRIEKLEALLDDDRVIASKLIARAERVEAMAKRLIEAGNSLSNLIPAVHYDRADFQAWQDLITGCRAKLEDK